MKKPKLRSDEAKLKELFICCANANYREVRAIAFHFPWLLAMTDDHGFTALHHAEMSGDAEFMAKLLDLYADPRAHTRKFVTYECEEDMRLDGIRLQSRSSVESKDTSHHSRHSHVSRQSLERDCVVVRLVDSNSKAAAEGVVPGDTLEGVEGLRIHGLHRVVLTPDDVSDVLNNGHHIEDGYPLTLEFDGPASAEILGRNSWTPLHAAAGGGAYYKTVCRLLRQEQQKLPTAAHDGKGYTPEHWRLISKRSTEGPRRRPLSAGPCARRRPSVTGQQPQRSSTQQGERTMTAPGRPGLAGLGRPPRSSPRPPMMTPAPAPPPPVD